MIRVTLRGRLGNQMFQYATAYALARRRDTHVVVDTSHYWHPRRAADFELWRFVRLGLARLSRSAALVHGALRKLGLSGVSLPTFSSSDIGFLPAVNGLPDGTRLDGWFQSPRYFSHVATDVRAMFDLAPFVPRGGQARLAGLRRGGAIVSVHVRRGDYLNYDNFGIPLGTYYRAAMAELGLQGPCTFIVFSDDLAWCRTQPVFQNASTVFSDDLKLDCALPLNDLALISSCDHNIMCNSTFSWWAAWLGQRQGRRVIMPRQWLKNMTTDDAGLSVEGWTQI